MKKPLILLAIWVGLFILVALERIRVAMVLMPVLLVIGVAWFSWVTVAEFRKEKQAEQTEPENKTENNNEQQN
jgi:threonine/homoserine/homoserine lactone efflux protein